MSENHLSNNLDKIIQLISIEQVRCLMKQMKIDDTNYNTNTTNATATATNTNETLDQLTKINSTLLLIVDKISAIETEIKMIKETKQNRSCDDEEHIKLQIEEKDIDSAVEILNTDEVSEVEEEEEDNTFDFTIKVASQITEEDELEAEEAVVNLEEEAVISEVEEEELEAESAAEEAESAAEVVEEDEEELEAEELEAVSEAEESESEVEIEDDEPLSAATTSAAKNLEATTSAATENLETVVNLEEDEEEVFEIEIDDVTYFATHEENGILYEVDKDGDVGKKVGIIKDGEPIFL